MKVFIFIFLFVATNVECLRLQLFDKPNYQDFKMEFVLSSAEEKTCYDVKSVETALSLKTDKCVMLYDDNKCSDFVTWNWRVDKDTPTLDKDFAPEDFSGYKIGSFHVCSQELGGGGPLLDVDFISGPNRRGYTMINYLKVCGCQNIESSVALGKARISSLNNHGNGIALFEKEHCEPPYFYVPPGTSTKSNYLATKSMGVHLQVRSFSTMETANCHSLKASVTRFVFKNDSRSGGAQPDFENVTLSLESVFRNNGPAKITQDYTATQRIKEALEFTKATGWTKLKETELSASLETEGSFNVPMLTSAKVKATLGGKYKWSDTTTGGDTDKKTVENEETFSIKQAIEIPPCTEYRVSSFIKMVKNQTIEYTAFARLTGKAGDTVMRKNELKASIGPGMDYVRDIDEHTVEVSVKGEMFATYGVKTLIVGNGHHIQGCLKDAPATPVNMELPVQKV